MAQLIDSSNENDNLYFDSIRYVLHPNLEEEEFPNNVIDSIAYLISVEDDLIEEIPSVLEPNYSDLNKVKKYLVFKTAFISLDKFSQIIHETELQETTRYAEVDFDKTEKRLLDRIRPLEEDLGLTSTTTITSKVKISISKSRLS